MYQYKAADQWSLLMSSSDMSYLTLISFGGVTSLFVPTCDFLWGNKSASSPNVVSLMSFTLNISLSGSPFLSSVGESNGETVPFSYKPCCDERGGELSKISREFTLIGFDFEMLDLDEGTGELAPLGLFLLSRLGTS